MTTQHNPEVLQQQENNNGDTPIENTPNDTPVDRGIHEEDTWDEPNLSENVHDHGRKSTGIEKDQKAHVMTRSFQSKARKDLRDGIFLD